MVTVKSIPEGVQAAFPMLVCHSPEAEMHFCASAFGAVEQVRRAGPDGSPIHIAMRISEAFLVVQAEFPKVARILDPSGHVWTVASRLEETTEEQRSQRWADVRDAG
jgi:PhnB protein